MTQYFNVYSGADGTVRIADESGGRKAEAVANHIEYGYVYSGSDRWYAFTLVIDGDKVSTVNLEDAINEAEREPSASELMAADRADDHSRVL